MRTITFSSLAIAFAVALISHAAAAEPNRVANVMLDNSFEHDEDISGIAAVGDGEFLVIGNDEDNDVLVLKRVNDGKYEELEKIKLLSEEADEEIDIEGITCHGRTIYVIGSHSRKRTKVDPEKKQSKNRERLTENTEGPLRETLFRFTLSADGELNSEVKRESLRARIHDDPILKTFAGIPSKEGGVDIEGIATDGENLYIGFRGPVLRDGYVPVLVLDFENPDEAEMLFVNLSGHGIRDMVAIDDGFLLIGGPIGEGAGAYELFKWDGKDGLPGKDVDVAMPQNLGRVPAPAGAANAKAEGLAVIGNDLLIIYDGAKDGGAGRFKLPSSP